MADTKIEWATKVWNVTRGCARISPGCGTGREGGCYAERQAHRFSGPGGAYEGLTVLGKHGPRWTGECRFIPDKLAEPLSWRKPERIFVNSMSDLFHADITDEQIAAVFGVMAASPQHTYLILTKRAERLPEWFAWATKRGEQGARLFPDDDLDWRIRQMLHVEARRMGVDLNADARQNHGGPWPLPNVHIGVSCEDQQRANERIPHLLRTPAAVRFVSAEPLLGPIDLAKLRDDEIGAKWNALECGLNWVIVGSESGPGARPMAIEWARKIVDDCRAAGVAVFTKQIANAQDRKGGNSAFWPPGDWPREFPAGAAP